MCGWHMTDSELPVHMIHCNLLVHAPSFPVLSTEPTGLLVATPPFGGRFFQHWHAHRGTSVIKAKASSVLTAERLVFHILVLRATLRMSGD